MLAPRQQPLLFVVVRTTLKVMVILAAIAGLLAFVSLFAGCSTTITHRNGTKWVEAYSNIKHLEAKSGDESIVIYGMNNSAPTRESGKIIGAIVGDVAALFVPGAPVVKGAVIALPHVTGISSPGN